MSKRSNKLDSYFFSPPAKKTRMSCEEGLGETPVAKPSGNDVSKWSLHPTYPFDVPNLSSDVEEALNYVPAAEGREINDQPDLDLVYYEPYIPKTAQRPLFEFLRGELFFYRVKYTIKRGPAETAVNTPRFTTVFGVDETSRFSEDGGVVDATSGRPVARDAYKCKPRPLPQCLDRLRVLTENTTGRKFNFALVNYYASGSDSISYHSDDERFLGTDPAIASFTLGAKRDFLLRHKKTPAGLVSEQRPMKLLLASGDMIVMRGRTQSNWEHSIPKRKGGESENGRINITFRRAMVKGGTENYYRYNVGDGQSFKWNPLKREMLPFETDKG